MIKKEKDIPLYILKLLALLRRLAVDYAARSRIEGKLRSQQSGYRGETSINFYLSFVPDDYYILQDLRLCDKKERFFQLDTSILTPKFIFHLEVKNHSGTLIFDPVSHQMIQTVGGEEFVYDDPVIQIQRQKSQLKTWLADHKFPPIPIISFVVISYPSTHIKFTVNHREYQRHIIRSSVLPSTFEAIDKSYKHTIVSKKDMQKLSRLLIKNHVPYDPDVLELFKINPADIIKGAHCPKCDAIPMVYHHGIWTCVKCRYKCRDAHVGSLGDFALLYGKYITNQQFRDFLGIESPSVAIKTIKKMGLTYTGTYKDRIYQLPYPPKVTNGR